MKRVMIACSMIEHEIKKAVEETGSDVEIVWMDRGLHVRPEELQEELQKTIDNLQDNDEILLCYGLCGNGTAGLVSQKARLVIPRFDDCINMMLCTGKRRSRGLVKAGVLYISGGWTEDKETLLGLYDDLMERFDDDEEMVEAVIEMTYGNYHSIALLDTGCSDRQALKDYVDRCSELFDLEPIEIKGTNRIMKQLITGEYDSNFIILEPEEAVTFNHFNLIPDKGEKEWDYLKRG